MAKRKTDEQLRSEISFHSATARELLGKSHELHMQSLNAELTVEHIQIMKQVIDLQRTAIRETEKVGRLEKTLLNRQIKTVDQQRAALLKPEKSNSAANET